MPALPDYGNPPVIEVAVGLQFAPLQELCSAHIGAYWDKIKSEYGTVQEQAPIPHALETSELAWGVLPSVALLDRPDLPRTFFINASGSRLIQLQRDHFIFNWRKMQANNEYPRFPSVKQLFFQHWKGFCAFLEDAGLPSPIVDQCDVTYVNHMIEGENWKSFADLGNLFTVFAWRTRTGFLPSPEGFHWSLQFLLPERRGRLYVEALPVLMPNTNTRAIRLTLTVRGAPAAKENRQDLDSWFELGREWIVKGFADLAAENTDTFWKRKA